MTDTLGLCGGSVDALDERKVKRPHGAEFEAALLC